MGTRERLTCVAVVIGLGLRLWEYSSLRDLYMDEEALLTNVVGVPAFDFRHVLKKEQLAPPGFLVAERVLVRLPVSVRVSGRLFPLVCGLGSVLLIVPLARRYLDPLAAPVAASVLALSDHLIYYSAEIKPYSCDLLSAMAALLVAVPEDPAGPTPRRLAALAGFGLVAPWFSFPVVFVLAGVGFHLLARRAVVKDWRGFLLGVVICAGWLASFGGCFALSHAIVSKGDFLWIWWDFAFLPIPPRGWADVELLAVTVANVFINPGSLVTPLGFPVTAGLACGLAAMGCVSLARRWKGGLFLVLSPLVFTLTGSALRQYPFHGRLILSLVPTYHLLLAEGLAFVGRRTRVGVTAVLASVFLFGQASDIVWNQMVMPKTRSRPPDTHADLKGDLLDHLERERWKQRNRVLPKPPAPPPGSASPEKGKAG